MLPVPLWWLCFFCCCNYCCPSLPWVGVVVRAFPYRVQMQLINRAISSLKSSFLLNSRSKFYKNKNCLNLRQQILHQWLITSRVVIANIHVLYNRYRSRICNASTYFYVSFIFMQASADNTNTRKVKPILSSWRQGELRAIFLEDKMVGKHATLVDET